MLSDAGFRVVDVASTSSGYEDTFEGVIEDHPLVLAQSLFVGGSGGGARE